MTGQVGAAGVQLGAEYLANPPRRSHAVQFYDADEFLLDAVLRFIGAGLAANEQVLTIAARARGRALRLQLEARGYAIGRAIEVGQLVMIDAEQLLQRLMADDMPDTASFRVETTRILELLAAAPFALAHAGKPQLRVYGEMVDLLAHEGNVGAAVRLEELWAGVTEENGITMLCGYGLANFRRAGDSAGFDEICRLHHTVLPTERFLRLPDDSARLMEISRMQQQARALESELKERLELEAALKSAREAHRTVEEELRVALRREREARGRVEASHAFKEVFLGMLGHDLRNPLNAILTTARLMTMSGDYDPETHKRLTRVVSSGERMHRMIEQILDTTRARLAAGIGVSLGDARDVVPIVQGVVAEVRKVHSRCCFELEANVPCPARVDDARFAQVLQNLLDNAVSHGDRERAIRIEAAIDGGVVCIGVHNHGPAIPADAQASLFDPFSRGGKPQARSAGLGLGLYISQHIVRAHGGNLTVESSERAGTRFEIRLPCP